MSFDIPASVERDIEQYAQAERISPAEAVVKLIQSGLKANKTKAGAKSDLSADEWQTLRAIPGFAFLEALPDEVADRIETASKRTRAERFSPRA